MTWCIIQSVSRCVTCCTAQRVAHCGAHVRVPARVPAPEPVCDPLYSAARDPLYDPPYVGRRPAYDPPRPGAAPPRSERSPPRGVSARASRWRRRPGWARSPAHAAAARAPLRLQPSPAPALRGGVSLPATSPPVTATPESHHGARRATRVPRRRPPAAAAAAAAAAGRRRPAALRRALRPPAPRRPDPRGAQPARGAAGRRRGGGGGGGGGGRPLPEGIPGGGGGPRAGLAPQHLLRAQRGRVSQPGDGALDGREQQRECKGRSETVGGFPVLAGASSPQLARRSAPRRARRSRCPGLPRGRAARGGRVAKRLRRSRRSLQSWRARISHGAAARRGGGALCPGPGALSGGTTRAKHPGGLRAPRSVAAARLHPSAPRSLPLAAAPRSSAGEQNRSGEEIRGDSAPHRGAALRAGKGRALPRVAEHRSAPRSSAGSGAARDRASGAGLAAERRQRPQLFTVGAARRASVSCRF